MLQQTTNGIHYEVNKPRREVFLLPIRETHTIEQLKAAKDELDARYVTYLVGVHWQRNFMNNPH